jgi:hypothetical protein
MEKGFVLPFKGRLFYEEHYLLVVGTEYPSRPAITQTDLLPLNTFPTPSKIF